MVADFETPALATRISRRSPTILRVSFASSTRPVSRRQIGRDRVTAAASFAYLGDDTIGFSRATAVMHQNLRTGRSEGECAGAADAAGGAGNESRFSESVVMTWVPDDWTLTPGAVSAAAEPPNFLWPR